MSLAPEELARARAARGFMPDDEGEALARVAAGADPALGPFLEVGSYCGKSACYLGPVAARLVAIPVLVSIISAAHGLILTAARVFHAMARDRAFFAKLGEVHPRYGTPAFSIIALSAWSAVPSRSPPTG